MVDSLGGASSSLPRRLFDGAARGVARLNPKSIAGAKNMSSACQLFEPVLSRLQADALVHFGTAHAQLIPLAYEERPFSHVLRVGVCRRVPDSPDLHVFVKIFKPKSSDGGVEKMRQRVAHDFLVSQRFSEAMRHGPNFTVVRPVVCYVEHLAMVTEQAHGETLMAHLDSRARWFPGHAIRLELSKTLSRIGRWLRAFQAIEPPDGQVLLSDLRAYVDVRLQRLVVYRVLSPRQRQRILECLDVRGAQVPTSQLASVLVHGDFAPGNILVSGEKIAVLDLPMVQHGSLLHDISRLYVQLDALRAKPQFRPGLVETLQSALLAGFDDTLMPTRPLFCYLQMLHRVNHLGTLALNAEPFPARALSRRARRIHLRWIDRELLDAVGA